jgi:myo-inositol-1(or 4)-monophosphatase
MLYPWDYAATSLIVLEAGGFISTAEGGMITLD